MVLAEAWKRSVSSRPALIVATLVAAALLMPAVARADAPDESGVVTREPYFSAWVFSDDELIVLTGPPLAQGCFGQGFLSPIAKVVTTPSGAVLTKVTHTDLVHVFDNEGFANPLDWLFGYACPAIQAGLGPEPLASGDGIVKVNSHITADGDEIGNVNLTAKVTTPDGEDVHLNIVGDGIGTFGNDFINYGG